METKLMSQRQTFKRLMAYLKNYKWLTSLALIFLLLTTIVQTLIPLVARYFIDRYIQNVSQTALVILVGYFLLYVWQMIFSYVGNYLFAKVAYSIVRDIRQDAFDNIQRLGMVYFDQTPAGSIVSRLTNDTEAISQMFTGILSSFISAIFIFATTLYTMIVLDIRLTILVAFFLSFHLYSG